MKIKKWIACILSAVMVFTMAPVPGTTVWAAGETGVQPELALYSQGTRLGVTYTGEEGSDALVFVAEYNEQNAMTSVQSKTCRSGTPERFTFEHPEGRHYKAFALDPDTRAPLCQAAEEVELFSGTVEVPFISGNTAEATSLAVRQYMEARILLEDALAIDLEEIFAIQDDEEREAALADAMATLDRVMDAYDRVSDAGAVLYAVTESEVEEGEQEALSLMAEKVRAQLMGEEEEARHWAEELTKKYDSVEGNKKLKGLASMLGCDAREAYEQLVIAQQILKNGYDADVQSANRWIKGLTVVKTGAKVGLFVGACVATGGMATAVEATGLLVGATDVSIEVAKTSAVLIAGDESNAVKRFEETTKPLSTACYIYSLLTFDINQANPGEIIAFFGDYYENAKDNLNTIWDELKDFKLSEDGTKLTAEAEQTFIPEEVEEQFRAIQEEIEANDGIQPPPSKEEIESSKERIEEDREALTDDKLEEKLEDILREENILEENETLENFVSKEENKDYAEAVKDTMNETEDDNNDDDPPPPKYPIFHDDGPGQTHRNVYWKDEHNNYVGLYEHYYEDVLEAQRYYDEDGKIVWSANYSVETGTIKEPGQIIQRSTYTNGYEIDSVRTDTHYFYTEPATYTYPPDYAIGQVRYTEQKIFKLVNDEETGDEYKTDLQYYGVPHCDYDYNDGIVFLAERNTGEGIYWKKKEEFDHNGKLSLEVADNGDGTITQTDYYTSNPGGYWRFDPTDHKKHLFIYTYHPGYYGYLDESPGYEEKIREEEWLFGSREVDHVYETDEEGNTHLVRYTRQYGYEHRLVYPAGQLLDFEVVTSEVIYL